ncbi:MAG: type I-U CRISPR-associated helicase/endonuclease Cas3, partial [Deltaproteobacteria bacterium]|nr:type I-U CRISPR-associated helicase/endonuclease Cas3 [Deltaproteobacteria bacterium]
VFGLKDEALKEIVPPFNLLSLSATGRTRTDKPFGLTEADLKPGSVPRKRLDARKRLTIHPLDRETKLKDALAEEAWKLSGKGASAVRCIVFCHKRKDAADTKEAIEKLARGDKKQGTPEVKVDTELFVGGRRVFEREDAAKRLKKLGFIAGTKVAPMRPAFVLATSAGEVGVDLDADHMVSDLVAWERMVQRLGRVNRRGDGAANVIVLNESQQKPEEALSKVPSDRTKGESKAVADYEAWVARSDVLDRLPCKDGTVDASPGAIRSLKLSAEANPELQAILDAATTPAPLRPALSRALVEAWSMTSLKKHTGRPEIAPWLRGWINEARQTAVVWRTHLPVRTRGNAATNKEIEAYFEAAPPHASERLETETYRVVEWMTARAKALLRASNGQISTEPTEEASSETSHFRKGDVAAVALSGAGDVRVVLSLEHFVFESDDKKANKRRKDELVRNLAGATLVVDVRIAGLHDDGLLDHKAEDPPGTVDDGESWLSTVDNEPVVRFRVRVADADSEQFRDVEQRWKQRLRFATVMPEDREPSHWLIVEKWLHDAATEDDRSAGQPQLLDTHRRWAECRAHELAGRLGLPEGYTDMLAIAARLHDEGKRAKRWQRAFNAPTDGDYAKTLGPINQARLDGYRHEFGSLKVAAKHDELLKLPNDLQDLALHLIAAHHGFARPVISVNGCEDTPPSALEERARDVALRFARLQKRWGPWGLSWWEALLRASDLQASRDNDALDADPARESA